MPDIWVDVNTELAEAPLNVLPLLDDTDFKTRETGVTSTSAGLDVKWNFINTTGGMTQTSVTPTTAGDYLMSHQGSGVYSIEIPASTGSGINNNASGHGWFTGYATGILPWRGPVIGFRAAGINDALIDGAWSATRGLSGTALPNAAADAAGGLPISDAGGLDMDAQPSAVWAVSTRTLTSASVAATAVWNSAVDGTLTYAQTMKLMTAVNFSNSTGGGTTSVSFQNFGSTMTRVSYSVTTVGNRTLTTYDLS